jgi:hypothetical protein
MLAKGANLSVTDYHNDLPITPVVIRSLAKADILKYRKENNLPFYYMDTGYTGGHEKVTKEDLKPIHRIVYNDLQLNSIVERPSDRWKKFGHNINNRRTNGKYILIVPPSDKPCRYYNIDVNKWIPEVRKLIRQHTDRPIKVRLKKSRQYRRRVKPLYADLQDCHALVTYQSIAAIESILFGVPAFTLAPCAADPVADKDLSQLDNPTVQDRDKIHKWAHHLAYGQFHVNELKDGTAWRILHAG